MIIDATPKITAQSHPPGPPHPPDPPRAFGKVTATCKRQNGDTVLDRLHQRGSLKLLFPTPWAEKGLTGILLNTAGGMTGGDRFEISATVAPHCRMCLTTQAAERVYRARPGETAHLSSRIEIGHGGRMDWLPQETLLYEGGAFDRRLCVHMQQDARLLMVEPLILGRPEMGEAPRQLAFRDRIDIWRKGRLVFADRTRIAGDATAIMRGAATGGGATAFAGVLLVAPDAGRFLGPVREQMPAGGGASLIRPGVLYARILAPDGFVLRQTLLPLIARLAARNPPKAWML